MIRYRHESKLAEENHHFFEMANLRKQESGLPYDIWLDSVENLRNVQNKYIKIIVGVDGNLISVMITSKDDIKIIKPFPRSGEILTWVKENYETLFRHWNGELSDRQALNLLAKD